MHPEKRPTRVLVIEDDPMAVALLQRQLIDSGYVVRCAADGAEGLELAASWRPHIVLVDWILPRVDGLGVCRAIRQAKQTGRYVFVMMVTVHAEKARVIEAFEAGVDDFLSKPLDHGELLARLHAAARTIDLHKQVRRRERRSRRMSLRLEKLNQELRQMAMTDDLTGLINRREANRQLSHVWDLAVRYGHPLSCAMIDVDDFKQLNDTHGHATGDRVLRSVAEAMRTVLRGTDGVCRYGGDEFLLFFPHQKADEAAAVVERLRQAVAQIRGLDQASVTVSIGFAERDEGMLTFHDLIERADRALYHAKRMGKNNIWSEGLKCATTME